MTSGGPRARSGPPPERHALRNGPAGADWTPLPASGRQGEAPAWPLTRATKRELELWGREWQRPQAVEWERNGQDLEVALYVRAVRIAENPSARAGDRNLVKQMLEHLGLSLPGLARNRWFIQGEASATAGAVATRPTGTEGASVKSRFKVVSGGR